MFIEKTCDYYSSTPKWVVRVCHQTFVFPRNLRVAPDSSGCFVTKFPDENIFGDDALGIFTEAAADSRNRRTFLK